MSRPQLLGRARPVRASLVFCALQLTLIRAASAQEPAPGPGMGPELNPYACQGRAEAFQADRTIGQIEDEIDKLLEPAFLPTDPRSVRALKLCTIAELKKRVGATDAADYYQRAIAEHPQEPGYEFFLGRYYAGARGAKAPVHEIAEKHLYRALAKLEKLRLSGSYRDHHRVIENHTRKQLLVLYQRDGLPLLPWKAYPQASSGYLAPGASIASINRVNQDTRYAVGVNEMGGFTAETQLFERGPEPAGPAEFFVVARAPLRYRSDNALLLRHNYVGLIFLGAAFETGKSAAFDDFTQIGQAQPRLHDVDVRQLTIGYERSLALYPLFDLRLQLQYQRVHRVGLVEYHPTYEQDFPLYFAKPQLSRFIGSDKLTLTGTYALMAIPDLDGAARGALPPGDYLLKRGRLIAGVEVEYAFYSPLLLPSLHLASLRPYRTPTRGLYLTAGYVTDNELYGDRRIVNDTIHGGVRLEGPGKWDIDVHETWFRGRGRDITANGEQPAEDLSAGSLRSSLTVVHHLAHPDVTPGVPEAVGPFASDALSLAFPISWDKAVHGPATYENVRAGAQLWFKVFGTGVWGATTLTTLSYEYQYFYQFGKHIHNLGATVRLGWGDL